MSRRPFLLGLLTTAAIATASQALAQSAPQPPAAPEQNPAADGQPKSGGLQDIVVTARKRTENNQKAPATIVAVSGAEIQSRGISDPQGLEAFLPSATLRRQGPVTQVFIRGVGTRADFPYFASAAAFVYNGLIVNRYGTFGLTFDLDSVQSIAGPQGTLYGGSAAGGAINLFSARPKSDNAGFASVEYGNLNTLHASLIQNLTLSDTLKVRGAVDYIRRDSYNSAGLFRPNDWSGRLALLFTPSSDLTAHVFYSHGSARGRPSSTVFTEPFAFPNDPYRAPATGTAGNPILGSNTFQRNHNDLIGANIELNLGDNKFTYIPGYVAFKAHYLQYASNTGAQLDVTDREKQVSQELRWNREIGALQVSAGLFYLHNDTDYILYRVGYTGPTTFNRVLLNRTDGQINESYAAYAQGIVSLSRSLRLTVGGRVSRDEIRATGLGSGSVPFRVNNKHTHPDYRVGVDYDLAPRVLVYANVQTGYVPFGYNPDVTPVEIVPESKLFAISGGFKSRFLDNRVELNAEGFHYTYKKFQAIQFVTAAGRNVALNSQKATIYGVDVSARAELTRTTQLNASIVLENGKFDRFEGVGYQYSGNQLVYSPHVTFQGGLQQTIPLGNTGKVVGRIDTQYRSSNYATFQNFKNSLLAARTKTDAAVTYTPDSERWTATAFVRNLEDTVAYTTLSAATATSVGTGNLELPRTYGVQFSVKW